MPAGAGLSHAYSSADAYLRSLNLPTCTEAEFAVSSDAPRNLAASFGGGGRVALAWDGGGRVRLRLLGVGQQRPSLGIRGRPADRHDLQTRRPGGGPQLLLSGPHTRPSGRASLYPRLIEESTYRRFAVSHCSKFSPFQDFRNCGSDCPHRIVNRDCRSLAATVCKQRSSLNISRR